MAAEPRRRPTRIGSQIELGAPLGVGTMFWGDTWVDSLFGPIIPSHDLATLTRLALASNVTLFNTAEGYGGGTSEARLGNALQGRHADRQGDDDGGSGGEGGGCSGASPVVMTKFLPTAWRWTSWSFFRALEGSRQRLGRPIDIFYIHMPVHPCFELWVECACRARKEGLIKEIGISNCGAEQVEAAVDIAKRHGQTIAANQVLFSLLSYNSPSLRRMEQACHRHNITIVAYSGWVSVRAVRMTGVTYEELTPLRAEIAALALKCQVTMAQVCLNWAVQKGAVPLVGMKNEKHLHDALGCLAFTLTHDEVKGLDAKALSKATLEKPRMRRAVFVVLLSVLVLVYRVTAWVPRAWYLHHPLGLQKIKT